MWAFSSMSDSDLRCRPTPRGGGRNENCGLSGSSRRVRDKLPRKADTRRRTGTGPKKRPAESASALPRPELLAQFGKRVRALRDAAELTQDEVAAAAGIRQPYVADIERGVINPTVTTIANAAAALGVAVRDLV